MRNESLTFVTLLVLALARTTFAEEISVRLKDKRGVVPAGQPPHVAHFGQSLYRLPASALYPPAATFTVAKPYPAKPYPVTVGHLVPFQPQAAPPPPRDALWPLPWAPMTVLSGPSGLSPTVPAGRLGLLAASLASNPDIAIAAAAAQQKHMENLYHGIPGGPTKTGLLAARIAANPDIAFAAAAAQKHHGQHSTYSSSALAAHLDVAIAAAAAAAAQKRAQNHALTNTVLATHPDVAAAAFAAHNAYAQHLSAQHGSEFLAQLAGTQPSLATLTAAAHLGLHH